MTPPGLGLVALSQNAWSILETKKSSSYYFDLCRLRSAAEKNLGVFTPAISLLMGLDAALRYIRNEGLERIIARHSLVADTIRNGIKQKGLQLISRFPSDSLTVVELNNANEVIAQLYKEFGIIVAGGQDNFSGKVMRIGHLGYFFEEDAHYLLNSLNQVLG
ncbi:MAG: alanine--glyoxylate aminotransferase family protein [Ignavibacteriae bacterium]|nr:alanine--glyoxylate aminotransferase family protein [Ignavibacteriota bacterium]